MRSAGPFLSLLALAATSPAPAADTALASARRAQAMLGTGTWSRVIRIANRSAGGPYPRTVDALVFELSGVLWFYTEFDGTQSLSRYLNRTERDKASLGPLLVALDAGFADWTDAPEMPVACDERRPLRNGCFIECLALLRRRFAAGAPTFEPRLLSYYVAVPGGIHGHTVLQFRTGEGWMVIDPHFPKRRFRIRPAHPEDPRCCADALRSDVASARFLPLEGAFSLAGAAHLLFPR